MIFPEVAGLGKLVGGGDKGTKPVGSGVVATDEGDGLTE